MKGLVGRGRIKGISMKNYMYGWVGMVSSELHKINEGHSTVIWTRIYENEICLNHSIF